MTVRRRYLPLVLLCVLIPLEAAIAITANVASNALPRELRWLFAPSLVWPLLGILLAIAVGLSIFLVRAQSRADDSRAPRSSLTVVGAMPLRPDGWVNPSWRLLRRMKADGRASKSHPVVTTIVGGAGAGKSQLAGAYARARANGEWLVIWVVASTRSGLELELASAAERLGLVNQVGAPKSGAEHLRDHLQSSQRQVLLVIDGVAAGEDFEHWLPGAGRVHVVVTTQFRGAAASGRLIEVVGFDDKRAAAFLRKRLPDAPRGSRREVQTAVGHLPAALRAATAVIRREHLEVSEYLQRFLRGPVAAALSDPAHPPPERDVVAALRASLQSFRRRNHREDDGAPSDLALNFAAMIAPIELDVLLISATPSGQGTPELADLADWSLGVWNEGDRSVTLSSLVARLHLEELDSGELSDAVMAFSDVGYSVSTSSAPADANWPSEVRYLTRAAEAVWRTVEARDLTLSARTALVELRLRLGVAMFDLGEFHASEAIARSVLAPAAGTAATELNGMLRADALGTLAHSLLAKGDREGAIAAYRTEMRLRASLVASDGARAHRALLGLANALRSNGETAEAIALFHGALRAAPSDEARSESRGGLGFALLRHGRLEEAAHVLADVVAERQSRLGPLHLSTLIALTNLGHCRLMMFDPGALPLLRSSLEGKLEVLGSEDHPQTLISTHYLGIAELRFGSGSIGRELLRDTYRRRVNILGPTHPDVEETRRALE